MKNIYLNLPKPFFALAPLDDVTDIVFRQIIAECAPPDLFYTEFVNVDGLQSPGRERLIHKLRLSESDKPIIAQLWGKDPENFYKTAKEIFAMGFSGVDLNMGCPDKAVIKNGCCVALINNRELAQEIIKATREGLGDNLPLSVKTRLGFDEIDYSWHEFLLNQSLDLLTVHGRTKKEMSLVPANWEAINHIREIRDNINPKTLIVGNGDVVSMKQGLDLAKKFKLDGIMIGRGIFSDPFLFNDQSPWSEYSALEKKALYAKQIKLFDATYKKNERNINGLKKFCKMYINNFDEAKDLRDQLMKSSTAQEMLTMLS